MNIKIKSTQIYEEHKEESEEIYNDVIVKFLDKNIVINYNNNEIVINQEKKTIEIKREENNIFIELQKEHEIIYETPYGNMNLKTYGEEILVQKAPFSLNFKYKIAFGNTTEYKNIIEILEI